ncbi:hypothetical protein H0A73_22050 [Alcaligenaceae bacterium]|nr:hypothetical protein [Alcaligenaceae bacterium]
MLFSRMSRVCRAVLMLGTLVIAGCGTAGNRFDTADLSFLVPGETTLSEATVLLQGEPAGVYRQANGAAIARWAHTATLVTDAVYFNQELWLAFDSHGRFERIVKSNNVPHANLYRDGRRVDVPVPQPATRAAAPGPVAAGLQQHTAPSLPHAAVTYSINQ